MHVYKKKSRKIDSPVKLKKAKEEEQFNSKQFLNLKQYEFKPENFYAKNIVERIPRFLLKNGKHCLKQIIDEL